MREVEQELETEFETKLELEMETGPDSDCLNLGCGEDYVPEAWNVDIEPSVNPDEVVDLHDTPWPWPDGTFRVIKAKHVLEHLDPVPWGELVRVLAPGGRLRWVYPIGHARFEDPTHRQFWNWNTAAAIGGERKHSHQFADGLRLVNRILNWHVSGRLFRTYTWVRLRHGGAGAWLSQVPGLSGEVIAIYEKQP